MLYPISVPGTGTVPVPMQPRWSLKKQKNNISGRDRNREWKGEENKCNTSTISDETENRQEDCWQSRKE